MKRSLVLLLGACLGTLTGCSGDTPKELDNHSQANFVNGDFETGALAPWVLTPKANRNIAVVPPNSINDLALQTGGNAALTKVVGGPGVAQESVFAAGLGNTDTLKYPRFGNYSAVINEVGANYYAAILSQSLVTALGDIDPSDNKIHVRFVLSPVFDDGGHAANQQPYYYLEIRNSTKGTKLFSSFNYANQPGVPYKRSSVNSGLLYTDWQLFDVPFDSTVVTVGDTLVVDAVAAGCAQGGHWGELYIDGFGTYIPGVTVAGAAPAAATAGSALTYTFTVNNGGSNTATNLVVTDQLPAGTTFVSVGGLPAGVTCTTPAVGGTGSISCPLGSLAAGANEVFTLTVNINAGATGSINNGNYNVSANGSSPLIGPLVTTTIVNSFIITANVIGGNGTITCQSPVAPNANSVCTITPAAGYGLATLTQNGNDVFAQSNGSTFTIANVTAPHTVTASFGQVARFTINATVMGGNGTLICQTPVAPGASSVCVATPAAGYALSSLILDTTNVTAMVNGSTYTITNVLAPHNIQATFVQAKYIITAQVLGGNGTLTCTNAITGGQNSTCTITPNQGYLLSALYQNGVDVTAQASGSSFVINNVTSNHLVQAIYVIAQYTITTSVPGGHGMLSCQTPVSSGASSVCTITPEPGYALTSLTRNGTNVLAGVTNNIYTISNVTASQNVQATFAQAMYNITTLVPDGNGMLSCTSPLASGQNSVCTITPAPGYGLSSLTMDGANVTAAVNGTTYTIVNVTASHQVQANFSTSSYNITANVPGGNGKLTCNSPVIGGSTAVCTIAPAAGFVLSALTLDGADALAGVNGNSYSIANVTSSHTVTAVFVPAVFTVTGVVPGGNGTLVCNSPITYGASSACMITADAGYVLTNLTLDGVNVTNGVSSSNTYTLGNVTANHIVQATFTSAPYRVTAMVPDGNGQISCTSPVLFGQTAVCTIQPAFGYILSGITLDGTSVLGQVNGTSLSIPNVTSDHTVQGVFTLSTYTITTSVPGGHGSISCTPIVSQGGSSTCTIVSENGYLLNTLTLDGSSVMGQVTTNSFTITNIQASHLVQGTFMQSVNVITIEIPGGHGTIVCTGPVLYGQAALCQINPAPGYQLGTLTLDGNNIVNQVGGNSFAIAAVTSPHTVRGTFVQIAKYDITVNILGGNGEIVCTTPVSHGQNATCTITAATGFVLDKMTVDGLDSRLLVQNGGFTLYNVTAAHTVAGSFKRAGSNTCETAADCQSGFCSDGVCCDRACNGQCEACDASGSVGTCIGIAGPPHVNHPTCGEYMCSEGSCMVSCATTADCVSGALCMEGLCQKGTASLSGGGITGCSATNGRDSAGAGAFTFLALVALGMMMRRRASAAPSLN